MANQKFANALAREPQNVPPIWFMRQAGRYHRHYQVLRAKHSFMELCKNPDLAAEVAMGPIEDFDFDIAILFSDLLFPLEVMGMGLSYDPAPKLAWHLSDTRIHELRSHDEALPGLEFQREAMKRTRARLPKDKSLIGFVGGPWTLFAYACEGEHRGGLNSSKSQIRLFEPFCKTLMPLLERNIQLQFDGGAEVVMLLDTASGELDPWMFRTLVVPQLKKLTDAFPKNLGYYMKGGTASHLNDPLFTKGSKLAGIGFDHRWDFASVLNEYDLGFVQGNFDQSLLFLPKEEFVVQVERYLNGVRKLPVEKRAGWVCGLGHGVLPNTPEDNVRTFVKMAREILS